MAIHQFADIDHPEASKLCQLHAVDYDLSSVIDLCDSVFEQVARSDHGHLASEIADVYTVTILIRFCRAVGGGIRNDARFSLEERQALPAGLNDSWLFFDAMRDKHIAHSINEFEQTRLRFSYIVGKEEEATISAISTGGFRLISLNGDQVDEMKRLCLELRRLLQLKIKAEEERLLPILQAESPARWIAQGMKPMGMPDFAKVSQRRKGP